VAVDPAEEMLRVLQQVKEMVERGAGAEVEGVEGRY